MDNKEFGQRVRQLREQAMITREQFCDDEMELSVRQLTRIEAGTCKPTFSKINFIADRLGMGLYELMPDYIKLPERYSKLKFDVLRTPTYGNEGLVETRNEMITEIYEEYYDDLPEEEQIAMDAFQSRLDTLESGVEGFGKEILEDYFEQVFRKPKYEVNDLLIIRLHLEYVRLADRNSEIFLHFLGLIEELHKQIDVVSASDLFVLRDTLLSCVNILGSKKYYEPILKIFDSVDKITQLTQDFQKKPIISLMKWKYALFVTKERKEAERHYQEAKLFSQLIENEILKQKIDEEWKTDTQQ
ncbi:helix-turn-helix domain-containing protein [Streptococcus ruminantium]|uniref:helix-turn-helix domain-containing protein n=1 Tax=Streptococcus ruminantium TaxID=1917441 RepID=UPI0012DDF764|nr:helix-turn-helix domain-containing protein [Streptococcus ruminantium]